MSLATMHWRKHAHQSIAAYVAATFHDTIHARNTAVTYYDGSTRTPGTASATKNSAVHLDVTTPTVSEACSWEFAGSGVANLKMHSAGQLAAGPTPKMAAPNVDTIVANEINFGLTHTAGAYVDWESATNPYASGTNLGLTRWWDLAGVAPWSLQIYEAEEAWIASLVPTAGASQETRIVLGGAYIDPDSEDSSNAEQAPYLGRILGVVNAAVTGAGQGLWSSAGGTTGFACHGTVNGQSHHRCLVPGTGTGEGQRRSTLITNSTGVNRKVNGDPVGTYMAIERTSDFRWRGRMREIQFAPQFIALPGQTLRISGVDVAYYVGCNVTAADGILLKF